MPKSDQFVETFQCDNFDFSFSNNIDMTLNTFVNLVNSTDDNQNTKLKRMTNHCTKIIPCQSKRKLNGQNYNIKPKKIRISFIHYILPPEIFEKILALLNYKEICQAQLICRRWKEIITNGKLLEKASGKFL